MAVWHARAHDHYYDRADVYRHSAVSAHICDRDKRHYNAAEYRHKGIVGIGVTFILVTGALDLSVVHWWR